MPFYLHQWTYKDQQIRNMLLGNELNDRREIVKTATEAFGGTLHHFFYAFGEFDGVAISSFKDNEAALACCSAIYAQGKILRVHTTPLFTAEEGVRAMRLAASTLKPPGP
jgi:uncharacterized protein with GYD domain